MKSKVLFVLLFFLTGIFSFNPVGAQKANPKLRALKIKVVTQKMSLNPTQEKAFLPLYNQYADELLVIYQRKHALNKNNGGSRTVDDRLQLDKMIINIKEKYKPQFLKIVSPQQLDEMYQGEDEFKQLLLKRLQSHPHN